MHNAYFTQSVCPVCTLCLCSVPLCLLCTLCVHGTQRVRWGLLPGCLGAGGGGGRTAVRIGLPPCTVGPRPPMHIPFSSVLTIVTLALSCVPPRSPSWPAPTPGKREGGFLLPDSLSPLRRPGCLLQPPPTCNRCLQSWSITLALPSRAKRLGGGDWGCQTPLPFGLPPRNSPAGGPPPTFLCIYFIFLFILLL